MDVPIITVIKSGTEMGGSCSRPRREEKRTQDCGPKGACYVHCPVTQQPLLQDGTLSTQLKAVRADLEGGFKCLTL